MKQGSASPYISYAVVRRARIGFSLMTHCICHERGTRFNAVPGSTPNNYEGDTKDRRIYLRDRNKHQMDEDGEPINSTDDEFMQPSDEDVQGNVLPYDELKRKRAAAAQKTPIKEDSKPAAQ
jgi:hypothetical protein